MKRIIVSIAAAVLSAGGLGLGAAGAGEPDRKRVACPADSIQEEVNEADEPTVIFISGRCDEDVTIARDDITLSGRRPGTACNRADPGLSAGATIDGTITIDGVRARIEFLEITGSGAGVRATNRADAELTCNDISANDADGVDVLRTSNAVLVDNLIEANGQDDLVPVDDPERHFYCGLLVAGASFVRSDGNTYRGNAYCAVEVDRQSMFSNAAFIPRRPGFPPDDGKQDVYVQRGCGRLDVSAPDCRVGLNDFSRVALEIFNNGNADLRNGEVTGKVEVTANSNFRVDDNGAVVGTVDARAGSMVRIRDRSAQTGGARSTTFEGTLFCRSGSRAYFSSVQCGQTCSGAIPGTCTF